jgi:hypothetical protein
MDRIITCIGPWVLRRGLGWTLIDSNWHSLCCTATVWWRNKNSQTESLPLTHTANFLNGHMARDGHGLPKVSPGYVIPLPVYALKWPYDRFLYPFGHPMQYAYAIPSSHPNALAQINGTKFCANEFSMFFMLWPSEVLSPQLPLSCFPPQSSVSLLLFL